MLICLVKYLKTFLYFKQELRINKISVRFSIVQNEEIFSFEISMSF